MKLNILLLSISIAFLATSCVNSGSDKSKSENRESASSSENEYEPVEIVPGYTENIKMNDSIVGELSQRGKEIARIAKLALKRELHAAMRKCGPEYAVSFCSNRAMAITDSVSKAQMVMISRLAMKNRNPHNAMTDNESNLYKGYVLDYINAKPSQPSVGWDDKGRPVYYQPIYTEALCLNCHGKVGTDIAPNVADKIAQLYPDDKATDFKLGEIRGMWAITFPEYKVVGVEH